MEDSRKKKFAILSVASILLVAMVVGLIAVMANSSTPEKPENTQPNDVKASVKAVCQNTDFKDTCIDALSRADASSADPKDLIKLSFDATIKNLEASITNSSLMKEVHADPRTNDALEDCKELAENAINDLKKSLTQMDNFDFNDFTKAITQLKVWLSGAMTYEQTCLDGFENTEGDAGEKMKALLRKAMELTSNGLAMITDISQALEEIELPKVNRRLLSNDDESLYNVFKVSNWIDEKSRNLKEMKAVDMKPNLTVAKDGSGDFLTVNDALKAVPVHGKERFVLYIKEGIYEEIVKVPSNVTNLMMVGDGPTKTRITGRLNFIDGTPTYHTATVAVGGDDFIAKDIGFENSAGADKHQAVALRVSADKAIFYNCHMDGYQDTLYAHTYRQYYRDCSISGTIDFIFGDSAAVFQNCTFVVRKPLDNQNCIVTAQGRKDYRQPTGLVIQNCSFVSDPEYYPVRNERKSYLARPWKEYSRTIIMESFIDDLIQPQGYLPWNESFALDTLFYTEFNNRGPGSSKLQRAQWPGVKELPAKRIERFTAGKFLMGDSWIPKTGVPYTSGFMFDLPKEEPTNGYSKKTKEEDRDDTPSLKNFKKSYAASSKPDSSKSKDDKEGNKSNSYMVPESQISAPAASPAEAPEASMEISPEQQEKFFFLKIFG